MSTLDVRDRDNKVVGSVAVEAGAFERRIKLSVLHEAVVYVRASSRQGTHSTRTRAEVHGTKKKPFRQKGTGRARQGDRRSPLLRKGGVTFGPQPRSYAQKMPRRKMRLALQMALSSLYSEGNICVVDEIGIDEPRTRRVVELLKSLGLEGKTLIYVPEANNQLALAARNLPNTSVVSGYGLSAYDLLLHDNLLTSQAGIARISEALR